MAKICCKVLSESETTTPCEPNSRSARRRRMEMRRSKFGCAGSESSGEKRQKLDVSPVSRDYDNAVESSKAVDGGELVLRTESDGSKAKGIVISDHQATLVIHPLLTALIGQDFTPKFGAASTCGRRRDMEDAVAIHPFFCRRDHESVSELHYFGVYDGHGCSHVAMKCRDRLHELVKEEIEKVEARTEWKNAMEKSFGRMDKEVIVWNGSEMASNCRCELQTPEYDVVGSTAVVAIVTPDKVIVANCGDSRAVLCRNGKAVPLSVDHKPDRPDELSRIQAAGGRVLFWDCPRVLGVLAMSRAIGDNYLKPFVSCEPEVTVTDRTAEDDCLILASDGLWDVVSNDTACGVARMCLRGKALAGDSTSNSCLSDGGSTGENADKACLDASMLLTKLALARRSSDNVSVVVIDLKRNV